MPATNGHALRRSSRVPVKVPVHVTSMEPRTRFSEICETLVVSAHGCALRLPVKLDTGSALRLHTRGGQEATAYVVFCQPMGSDGPGFRLGAQLERPQNFWGLESYPDDWRVLEMPAPVTLQPPQKLAKSKSAATSAATAMVVRPQPPSPASREILDTIEEHLSEDRLRGILATLVRPLQAEVTELREKLAASAKRNRFEVSLESIPPELEEKLWERLRQDVGARVLEQTQEQSAAILASVKMAIEQKTGATLTEFRHRLAGELHSVEQRAQVLSKELTASTQQHLLVGLGELRRQSLEAGSRLDAQGEKLLTSLQGQLVGSHDAHRREIERIHADAGAKAFQLQSEVTDLGMRIVTLNESVRRLESDLDAHLDKVAGEIVSAARTQLENAAALVLKDLQARGANEVEGALNEICGHLRTIQNRIENSCSGSLKAQSEEAVQLITEQFEELALQATEKWRLALARDLASVANALGQQIRQELAPDVSRA
jgi:hypothetical protein